jgi:hypothetical protein
MIERAMDTIPLNVNVASSVLTLANKKFLKDPGQERRALAETMGQTLTIDNNE